MLGILGGEMQNIIKKQVILQERIQIEKLKWIFNLQSSLNVSHTMLHLFLFWMLLFCICKTSRRHKTVNITFSHSPFIIQSLSHSSDEGRGHTVTSYWASQHPLLLTNQTYNSLGTSLII